MEVKAATTNLVDPDLLDGQNCVGCLPVLRHCKTNVTRWWRILIDVFGSLEFALYSLGEFSQGLLPIRVDSGQGHDLDQNQCFKFVKLRIRHKALVIEIRSKPFFKRLNTAQGVEDPVTLSHARKIARQSEEVDHRRDSMRLLSTSQMVADLPSDSVIGEASAEIQRNYFHWPEKIIQDVTDKTNLGKSFAEHVEACQRDGIPPMTFFSKRSPTEYSSNQAFRSLESSRSKWLSHC